MLAFIKSIFSEDNGQGSWARIGSFCALIAVIVWATKIVWNTHTIPPLTDATAFFSAPYLINKIHDGATTVFGKGQ